MPLLSDENITEEQREEIWSWGVAQLLVLMWEHGTTTMKRVHAKTDEELVEFLLSSLRDTLDRFFSIEDSTARVLGGGACRCATRDASCPPSRRSPLTCSRRHGPKVAPRSSSCKPRGWSTRVWLRICRRWWTRRGRLRRWTSARGDGGAGGATEEQAAVQIRETQLRRTQAEIAVIFDFDGTLGDTESPAMEVAFWELAPYFPGVAPEDLTPRRMKEFHPPQRE